MKPDLEALRSLPLLRSFPDDLLAALNETADLVRFAAAEEVFKAGERLSQLHYLLSGSIGATRLSLGEEDDLVDVLLPVQPLCLSAVLLDLPAPIGAYTLTAGHLITLSASRLRELIAGDAGLARPFLDYALRQAHEQTLENSNLKLRSSAQRLAGFMLGLIEDPEEKPARFVLPFKKELVAVRIGCTRNICRGPSRPCERLVCKLGRVPCLCTTFPLYGRSPTRPVGQRTRARRGSSNAMPPSVGKRIPARP